MTLPVPISVFTLSFSAFLLGMLSSWLFADPTGAVGGGSALGAISSLFLAFILTRRRARFSKIVIAGSLAGLFSLLLTRQIGFTSGGFAEGGTVGLALGVVHYSLLKREISPSWIVASTLGWGVGFGVVRSAGDFYGLFLGATFFALTITLAAARPLRIVHGWAVQHARSAARRNSRSKIHQGFIRTPPTKPLKKALLVQRTAQRRKF